MKSKLLFMSVLASLLIAGCAKEGVSPEGENEGNVETNTSYMAVNLVSADISSRAAAGYEDGSEEENNVTSVRFYFFNGLGGISSVKLNGSTYVNYYDWTPESQNPDGNNGDDIEKKLAATIVINTKAGDKLPQMIAAVINPDGLGAESKSLTQLKAIVKDYTTLTESGKFVMFNSVFEKDNKEFCAVPLKSENLQKTETAAKEHPVTIYVERSVAKVRVSIADAVGFNANGLLALKDKNGDLIKVREQQVCLRLDGWGLSADTDEGRLVKKINPAWTGWAWNGTHRSFWAINSLTANNRYHDYNSISTPIGGEIYTNENAQKDDINGDKGLAQSNTKVILKGTLCRENGDPVTLVRHLGSHFADTYSETETANLPELKKSILAEFGTKTTYYYDEPIVGGGTTRKQIDESHIKILVANQIESENSKNNCYVYAQLTDAAKGLVWYDSLDESATPIDNADVTINNSLKNDVSKALVWRSGMTYYFYDIRHSNGESGVVRNHIYDTRVKSIAGLGTPVYDPSEDIYTEIPDQNDHYIAAEINILSWRVVSDDYDLEW